MECVAGSSFCVNACEEGVPARLHPSAGPMLTQYFLDNPHRVALSLLPDGQLAAEQSAEEEARLQARRLPNRTGYECD